MDTKNYKAILKIHFRTIVLLFLLGTTAACNEDINVSIPDRNSPPIIESFSPKFGKPGDIIEIKGQNLALVDSVYLGESKINLLRSRLSNEVLEVQLVDRLEQGYFLAISESGRSSSRSKFTFVDPATPNVEPAGVPATGVMNETIVIRCSDSSMLNISRVFFQYYDPGEKAEYTSFTFQTKDSIGVVVPVLPVNTAKFGYTFGKDSFRVVEKNITLTASSVTIATIPEAVTLTQRFEITGDNLNLIDSATIDGAPVTLFKDQSNKFKLILKTPYNTTITPGTKTLRLFDVYEAEAASESINMVALPATPAHISLYSYADFAIGTQAYTKSVSSSNTNRQYVIYQLPMVNEAVNQVVINADSILQAPEAGQNFGHLTLEYNIEEYKALGGKFSNMSSPSDIAFAHVACATASNAHKLRELREPVLHFWVNTNGRKPTFDLYISLSAGYYFSNGNRTAVSFANITTDMHTGKGQDAWKLIAIRLADFNYKRGSSTYAEIEATEVQDAFYRGIVDEIRIRVRTTNRNVEITEYIEVNMCDFFISDRVRTDLHAVDITK